MKSEVFDWRAYRKLSGGISPDKVKQEMIRLTFNQFLEGNDIDPDDWGTSEGLTAWNMFNAGFLVCQALIDPPFIKEDN